MEPRQPLESLTMPAIRNTAIRNTVIRNTIIAVAKSIRGVSQRLPSRAIASLFLALGCGANLTTQTAVGPSGTARARTTLAKGTQRWRGTKPRIPIYLSDSLRGKVPSDGSFQDGIAAVKRAIEAWNKTGASEFRFVFAGPIKVTSAADDAINLIVLDPRNQATPPNQLVQVKTYTHGGWLGGFDIILATRDASGKPIAWSKKATLGKNDYDLQGAIAHGLGHGMGLRDVSGLPCIMAPSFLPGDASRRRLAPIDITIIQALYSPYSREGLVTTTPSVAIGTTGHLDIALSHSANRTYCIMIGIQGTVPGMPARRLNPSDSRIIPINNPIAPVPSAVFQNFVGILDPLGQGHAQLKVPALSALRGLRIHSACVTLDPSYIHVAIDVTSPVEMIIR